MYDADPVLPKSLYLIFKVPPLFERIGKIEWAILPATLKRSTIESLIRGFKIRFFTPETRKVIKNRAM